MDQIYNILKSRTFYVAYFITLGVLGIIKWLLISNGDVFFYGWGLGLFILSIFDCIIGSFICVIVFLIIRNINVLFGIFLGSITPLIIMIAILILTEAWKFISSIIFFIINIFT